MSEGGSRAPQDPPPPATPLGYYSGFSASKYAWLNIGEGEGTLQWDQECEEKISTIFLKIQEKRGPFQRFVTSIEAIELNTSKF